MSPAVVDGVVDGVVTVVIDNPGKRNALDDTTRHALLADLQLAIGTEACRAIVLTGVPGAFCAGGELATMPTDEAAIRRRLGEMQELARLLHAGPKPVVAAVDGPAMGSGLALAAACDRIVASPRARFGCSFGKVGLVPDVGAAWTLRRRLGDGVARDLMLHSRVLDVDGAAAVGLVDEVAPEDDVVARATAWATEFRGAAPGALAALKALLAEDPPSFDAFLATEMEAQVGRLTSADFVEGRAAFLERRQPRFGG
jgi:2-(1,2-epoxy-1,2-dihydrophenyl)acetyl-CoA isomerase